MVTTSIDRFGTFVYQIHNEYGADQESKRIEKFIDLKSRIDEIVTTLGTTDYPPLYKQHKDVRSKYSVQ